jgi:hypothetical protein
MENQTYNFMQQIGEKISLELTGLLFVRIRNIARHISLSFQRLGFNTFAQTQWATRKGPIFYIFSLLIAAVNCTTLPF